MAPKLQKAICLIALLFSFAFVSPVQAQSRVEVDEEVYVYALGKWRRGVVIDRKSRKLLVEYTFVNSKQDVFLRRNVRKLNEIDAMDYSRKWASISGKFTINGALMSLGDDGTIVVMKEDESELEIELSKLCDKDNKYVAKLVASIDKSALRGEIPARTPRLPEVERFEGSFGSHSTVFSASNRDAAVLGKLPKYMRDFKQAGVGFGFVRKDQDLVAMIPVGGPDQLVLMTAWERNPFDSGANFQSQVYWVSLKSKKALSAVAIPHEHYPLDYHPRHNLLVTFRKADGHVGEQEGKSYFTIWKLKPKGKEIEPVVCWEHDIPWNEWFMGAEFTRIVNDRILIAKGVRQEYVAWDFVDKKELYRFKVGSFFDAPLVVSPDRKHLIVPEDGNVRIVDATTGETTNILNVPDRHVSGANVNSDGTKLAALTERNIYVWDLESGDSEPKVYPAPLMGSPFSSRIDWVDDDHVVGQNSRNRTLYRLSLRLPVWSYEMDVSQYFLNNDPYKSRMVDGKVFYVAQPNAFDGSIAVGCVNLPGPAVAETTQDIDRQSLMVVKEGTAVAIDSSETTDPGQVEDWLMDRIEKNGWKYSDDAEIVLVASMGRGESQTVEYRPIHAGLDSRKTEKATFRPHFSSLKIYRGETILWQSGTSTGAPGFIRGDVQTELNKYQNPQLNFFKSVEPDVEIIDPKYSRGFGVSRLGLRGIEVISTSPPGREADPFAADEQAKEDRKKAFEDEDESMKRDREGNDGDDGRRGFGG